MIDPDDLPEPDGVTASGARRRTLGRPAICTHTGCRTVIAQPGQPVPNPCRCDLHAACGEYGDGVHPCLEVASA